MIPPYVRLPSVPALLSTSTCTVQVHTIHYMYKLYKYGQKMHLRDYYMHVSTTIWEQSESPTRHSHPILPQTPRLRYKKRNQKTAQKEKKEKKRGLKKGEREQRLPLHQMNEIVSELLLPASNHSNPHKQKVISSRLFIIKYVLYMVQFCPRWQKLNLIIWCLGLMSCSVVTGSSTLLPRCGYSIPCSTAKQSIVKENGTTSIASCHPAILPSCILPTAWWQCGWGGLQLAS